MLLLFQKISFPLPSQDLQKEDHWFEYSSLLFRIFDIFDWIESICFMWIWEGPEYWSCKSLRTFMSFPYIDPNPEGQTERKECLKENYVFFNAKIRNFFLLKNLLNLVLVSAVPNSMKKIKEISFLIGIINHRCCIVRFGWLSRGDVGAGLFDMLDSINNLRPCLSTFQPK